MMAACPRCARLRVAGVAGLLLAAATLAGPGLMPDHEPRLATALAFLALLAPVAVVRALMRQRAGSTGASQRNRSRPRAS